MGTPSGPDGIAREVTLQCFCEAYQTLGYQKCASGSLETDSEKIAIYAEHGIPTHAAKQLDDGRWKSKLGKYEDIEHNSVKAVEEYIYGKAVVYMKRRKPKCQRTNRLVRFRSFLSRVFGRLPSVYFLTQSVTPTNS